MFRRRERFLWALALGILVPLAACSDDNNNGVTDPDPPPTDEPQPPAAPMGLQATVSDGSVELAWSGVNGADSYTVERDVVADQGGFQELAAGLTQTQFVDDDVTEGATFLYRVRAVNEAGASDPTDPVDVVIGLRFAELTGTITGVRELSADTTYLLRGTVIVDDGGELRIPAGTLIQGDIETTPTALLVRTGGKLFSEGTEDAPVVFTSSAPEGERRRGDWGGVAINGRSLCNFPAGECIGEGNSGAYGGDILDDDSGRITFTRVEFAGFEVSFGNELNAWTFSGVGSGTEIHHLQAHFGLDDGFEWFGGTVDAKYLLATGISDDSFDYSTGWQGRGQFWIAQQDPNDADNGYEVDGNEDNFDAEPFTQPTIYNVTLIGKGPGGAGGSAGESTRGLLLRRGTAGNIFNHIVTGFGTSGVDIDNQETVDRIDAGLMSIQNSIIFDNATEFDTDDDGIDEEAIVMNPEWENRIVDPMLADPFNRMNPDFRPMPGSPALEGYAQPPQDDFFTPVDFIGGASTEGTPWYVGWTTTALN